MAEWFKHDIAAWMNGTEHLDDGPYRVYHVICQLIYQCEKSINLNESGIAGRCKMSVRMFRRHLEILISEKLITLESGRLFNSRAAAELENLISNRKNAAKGGKAKAKSLKNNDPPLAPLPEAAALRVEESRVEESRKKEEGADAPGFDLGMPAPPVDPDKEFFSRAVEIINDRPDRARSLAASLRKSCGGDITIARRALEQAAGRDSPKQFLCWTINNLKKKAAEPSDATVFMANADDSRVIM